MKALLLLLALCAQAQRDGRTYYYEDILTPFFAEVRPGVMAARRPGATPSEFQVPKPKGMFRVFVIGGSIAQRYTGKDGSLEKALRAALPYRPVEVLDCGMGGYDSWREKLVLDEVLKYEPSLIVLMTGHNEALGKQPVSRLRLWLDKKFSGVPKPKPNQPRARPGEAAHVEQVFEKNLRAMLRATKAKEVRTVVVLPPLNYDAVNGRAEPLADQRFVEGWEAFKAGAQATAEASWRPLIDDPSAAPDARSVALFYMGRKPEALDADPLGAQGATPSRLAAMARVASEESALVADADKEFRAFAAPALPDYSIFHDGVHWRHRYDSLATAAVMRALSLPYEMRLGPSEDRDDLLATLRYAFAEMARVERGSWRAAHVLQWLKPRMPKEFAKPDELPALVEGLGTAKGAAWGMEAPRVSVETLERHLEGF